MASKIVAIRCSTKGCNPHASKYKIPQEMYYKQWVDGVNSTSSKEGTYRWAPTKQEIRLPYVVVTVDHGWENGTSIDYMLHMPSWRLVGCEGYHIEQTNIAGMLFDALDRWVEETGGFNTENMYLLRNLLERSMYSTLHPNHMFPDNVVIMPSMMIELMSSVLMLFSIMKSSTEPRPDLDDVRFKLSREECLIRALVYLKSQRYHWWYLNEERVRVKSQTNTYWFNVCVSNLIESNDMISRYMQQIIADCRPVAARITVEDGVAACVNEMVYDGKLQPCFMWTDIWLSDCYKVSPMLLIDSSNYLPRRVIDHIVQYRDRFTESYSQDAINVLINHGV